MQNDKVIEFLYQKPNIPQMGAKMSKKRLITLLFICLLPIFTSAQKPIDVLLVIDGSGSMVWKDRDPDGLRLQGAKLFVDLCEPGDRIGVQDFSTETELIFPLYKIVSIKDKNSLKEKIEKIEAKGEFTDITLALQEASKEMKRAREKTERAVVLLTDGEIDPNPARDIFKPHNEEYKIKIRDAASNAPRIESIKKKYKDIVAPISKEILRDSVLPVYKSAKIPVFTVAFGQGADGELLREIADSTLTENVSRSYYLITNASQLQSVFSEIVEQLKKARVKISENEINFSGTEIVHSISIDDFIKEVSFKFIFSRKISPNEISISLRDPTGNLIDRQTVREGVTYISEEGYELYTIVNPVSGIWKAIIKGRSDVKLDITISTWGKTELKIISSILKSEYFVGDTIPIAAYLSIEGQRIASQDFLKNLRFNTEITKPNNKTEIISLYDDGKHSDSSSADGIYGNLFIATTTPGDYIIKIKARGATTGMRTFNFSRETEYRIRVSPKKETEPIVKPKIDWTKLWARIRKIIIVAIIVIAVLCVILILFKIIISKQQVPKPEKEISIPEQISESPLLSVTLKIKDGETKIVGARQIKDPSVDEKNMIVRRSERQFFAHCGAGTLELNDKPVTNEERRLSDGDIVKLGELYFEAQIKPEENNIVLIGISKEQAEVKIKKKEE